MDIRGKHVWLRAVTEDDLPQLLVWANDPDIWDLLEGWHFPYTQESQRRWYESLPGDVLNQRFAIEAPDAGLIGLADLVDIDWRNRHGYHGMLIGNPSVRGRGYGVDTIMAMSRYAFDELGLERLNGGMIEYNEVSRKVYARCGWQDEGVLRRYFFRHGRWWDRMVVGITREDYHRLLEREPYWDS
jgi:RimJ/RimL family protein N-acetyltransferase